MSYKRSILSSYYNGLIMLISSIIIMLLLIGAFIYFVRDIRMGQDKLMLSQLAQLDIIFQKINNTCKITGFEHEKNYIDFLNVKSFTGSQVGAMNLEYPDKWQGPYLENNFMIHEKLYMVVKTRKGYFIVPGEGVKLSNGKVIGKDIKLNYESDIEALSHNPKLLSFNDQPLAIKLNINPEEIMVPHAEQLAQMDIA